MSSTATRPEAPGDGGAAPPWRRLDRAARTPVSGSSLAAVRIAVGAVGALSAARIVAYGWVDALWAGPTHRFTYPGFGWVPQPSPALGHALVALLAVSSLALLVGWRPRAAALGMLVGLGWIELVDATTYLNHYWFLTLVLLLGLVVPWGASASVEARRRGGARPVARGWVWLLRVQVGVVYSFAGLAKLNADWLVRAEPLVLWLPARADDPIIGSLLAVPATAHVLAVAGAVFDCSIVALLLWRRTRVAAWLAVVAFHVATWLLFPIGVFPWLMIAMATVFFAPDWAERLHRTMATRLGRPTAEGDRRAAVLGASPGPRGASAIAGGPTGPPWLLGFVVAWAVVQVALPLRHLAIPGDHRWTGEGYRLGWNVLLTERSGSVTFLVRDPATGDRWTADVTALYTRRQREVMATDPDMIHQAALAVAADAEAERGRRVEVRVDAWLSFNGRPPARLIDPTVDLAAEPRDLWPDEWILPGPPPP